MKKSSIDFGAIVATNTLSRFANLMLFLALPILTLSLTGSPIWAGIVAFVNGGASVLGSLFGGVIVDRTGAKQIALLADGVSLISVLGLAAVLYWELSMTMFVLMVFFGAVLDGAGASARYALFPQIARKTPFSLEQATSIASSVDGLAEIIAPLTGGILIGLVGGVPTLLVVAGVFLVTFLGLLMVPNIPSQHSHESHLMEDFMAGFQYIWQDDLLRPLTLFSTYVLFLLMPFWVVLLPVYFGGAEGAEAFGLFNSVYGGFALIGAVVYGVVAHRLKKFDTINWINWVSIPILMIPIVVTSDSWLVWVFAVLLGLSVGPIMPILNSVYFYKTSDAYLGRVNGTSDAIASAAGPFGGLLFGLLIEFGSFELAYWLFVIGNMIIAGWYLLVPGLRLMNIDSYSDYESA